MLLVLTNDSEFLIRELIMCKTVCIEHDSEFLIRELIMCKTICIEHTLDDNLTEFIFMPCGTLVYPAGISYVVQKICSSANN